MPDSARPQEDGGAHVILAMGAPSLPNKLHTPNQQGPFTVVSADELMAMKLPTMDSPKTMMVNKA